MPWSRPPLPPASVAPEASAKGSATHAASHASAPRSALRIADDHHRPLPRQSPPLPTSTRFRPGKMPGARPPQIARQDKLKDALLHGHMHAAACCRCSPKGAARLPRSVMQVELARRKRRTLRGVFNAQYNNNRTPKSNQVCFMHASHPKARDLLCRALELAQGNLKVPHQLQSLLHWVPRQLQSPPTPVVQLPLLRFLTS